MLQSRFYTSLSLQQIANICNLIYLLLTLNGCACKSHVDWAAIDSLRRQIKDTSQGANSGTHITPKLANTVYGAR